MTVPARPLRGAVEGVVHRRRAPAEFAIVDLLSTAATLHGEQSRRLLLSRLSQRSETWLEVSDYPTGRQWFLGLVAACGSSLIGLAHLPAAARDVGLADATLAELARLVDRWEACEALADAPDDLLTRLETALTATAPSTVAHAYRLAVGGLAVSPPTHCDTAWAVLLHLAGRNAPLGGLPAYLAFLDQLHVLLAPTLTGHLGRFLRGQAAGAGLADQLADAHGRRTGALGPVHLILQFERSELVDGQVEMTCWRQWPGIEGFEPCGTRLGSDDDLEAMAEDAIGELEDLLAEDDQPVALEFVLPRSLLDLPVEHWRTENDTAMPRPIGLRFPVVLRSLERQRRRRGQREWRVRWRALTKGATGFAHCDAFRIGGGDHDHDRLQARFLREDAMVALVLSGPPREASAASELDIALNCGVPVVVWHRGGRTGNAVAEAVRVFLGPVDDGAGLTDLRDRARLAGPGPTSGADVGGPRPPARAGAGDRPATGLGAATVTELPAPHAGQSGADLPAGGATPVRGVSGPAWWLLRGTGQPLPVEERDRRWPPVPPWRDFDGGPDLPPPPDDEHEAHRRLGRRLAAGANRQLSHRQLSVINTAIYLRRPLLVTGGPGSGKSSLAYLIARELGLGRVLRWPITSRTTVRAGLYEYDAIGRAQAVVESGADVSSRIHRRASHGRVGTARRGSGAAPIGDFVHLGPLGTAMLPYAFPRVLLIDELDKSDYDLPNDLLTIFEDGEFDLPELVRVRNLQPEVTVYTADRGATAVIRGGVVRVHAFPIIIVTSNGEREFPAAFLRRCVRLDVPDPDTDALTNMVAAHFPDAGAEGYRGVVEDFVARRRHGMLAADQLLNAAHLVMSGVLDGDERDRGELLATVWRRLDPGGDGG